MYMKITTQITWVPVGEKLPDDEILVLVATLSGEVETGFCEDKNWRWSNAAIIEEEVTHWAELPTHPTACRLDDPEMAQLKRIQQPRVGDKFSRKNSQGMATVKTVSTSLVEVEHEDGAISSYTPAEFCNCALRTVSLGAIFTPAPEA